MLKLFTPVLLGVLALPVLTTPVTAAQRQKPVIVTAAMKPAKAADTVKLVVTIAVKDGWHTYMSVGPSSTSPVTSVELDLPDGVKALGEWNKPVGLPYEKDPDSTVLTGIAVFSRDLELADGAAGKVGLRVAYQACDDQKCMRPTTFKTSLDLPKRASTPSSSPSPFEAPIRLMVGKTPLNVAARQMYPSPAFYDVDGDDRMELVVGYISGSLNVYENTNDTGKGDPIWSKHEPLMTADGQKIKVSNW